MILNATRSGDGPPVILLHGLFGAARNFGAIQRALAPNYRVLALDMRKMSPGDSPHEPDMRYPTQAEDVRATSMPTASNKPPSSATRWAAKPPAAPGNRRPHADFRHRPHCSGAGNAKNTPRPSKPSRSVRH